MDSRRCGGDGWAVVDLAVRVLHVALSYRGHVGLVVAAARRVGEQKGAEFEQAQPDVRHPVPRALSVLTGQKRGGGQRYRPERVEREVDLVGDRLDDAERVVGDRRVAGMDGPGDADLRPG